MRIAFVSKWSAGNVHAWSGTPYFMCAALRKFGYEVTEIGPFKVPASVFHRAKRRLYRLAGMHYDYERHADVARSYSRQVQQAVDGGSFDLIVSPSSIPLAYLDIRQPVVFWTDSTFASLVGFYPGPWSNLAAETVIQGNRLEGRALKNCNLCAYSSDWAARSAIDDYGTDESRIAVIPFGANLDPVPTRDEVESAIAQRQTDCCRLLFIGVDWQRKGGDLVVETASLLIEAGLKVQVDVVGCEPAGSVPDFVVRHGFISKASEQGREALKSLLLESHFLFVPSLAECYGLVFAEASAHGLPSLARATGGIPTVVQDGVNGQSFPLTAPAADYARHIESEMADPIRYRTSARRSRADYEERLSWDAAVEAFDQHVRPLLNGKATDRLS
ncbi:glycosyltransferase family 4 protein [Rhodocyclus tenuis]|uniref:glycosyltransferase family 4 protein n=1 Tax=Rhodocyclus tenuis TaxID=1066 RepID=UPI0019082B03|nr:glycosyltransferase family 4 protein [Rhodocyclus tenuis]MBK1678906.1 hypothetical protein [Rhodocyclus tenuis]